MEWTTWPFRSCKIEIKMRNWYLITYDIRDEKRLRRVAKTLSGYGSRIQYSVFRCRLSERDVERLRWELYRIMDKSDDILLIGLCDRCVTRLRSRAEVGILPEEEKTVIL